MTSIPDTPRRRRRGVSLAHELENRDSSEFSCSSPPFSLLSRISLKNCRSFGGIPIEACQYRPKFRAVPIFHGTEIQSCPVFPVNRQRDGTGNGDGSEFPNLRAFHAFTNCGDASWIRRGTWAARKSWIARRVHAARTVDKTKIVDFTSYFSRVFGPFRKAGSRRCARRARDAQRARMGSGRGFPAPASRWMKPRSTRRARSGRLVVRASALPLFFLGSVLFV